MYPQDRNSQKVDEIDLAELIDLINQLLSFSRAGTFDENEGEMDAWERARRILDRYNSPAA